MNINESKPLSFVKAPPLRSGNEISKNENGDLDPLAVIIKNETFATVKFSPTEERQKELARIFRTTEKEGLSGQFVVQYDVERDLDGGEVRITDVSITLLVSLTTT